MSYQTDNVKIFPSKGLQGTINVPGDKSISHRSVIIGAISDGKVLVNNFLNSEDCNRTVDAFRDLGVNISYKDDQKLVISGVGLRGLKEPKKELYLGNSATSMRLILGILAGQRFTVKLTGDNSLNSRPMDRVIIPLSQMGAKFESDEKECNHAPITIYGENLHSVCYASPIPSAQVKSAILLAGLYADGVTTVIEPFKSRDHTERLLGYFGADIRVEDNKVSIHPVDHLSPKSIDVPGDISSAMYFIIAGLIAPDSKIVIKNVGVNPTRIGALKILKNMGANINILEPNSGDICDSEPQADIEIKSSSLNAVTVKRELIPSAIDELPLIMVAGCFAQGITKIYGASELRVKETDRIVSMVANLKKLGANIEVKGDNIFIHNSKLKGNEVDSFLDHRTAMSLAVAGLACSTGETIIHDVKCVNTSFPDFFDILNQLKSDYEFIQ